jgi:hypothetical protein
VSKHYTRNTVSVSKWCNKCKANTPHRVTDRRVNDCIPCIEKLEKLHAQKQVDQFRAEYPQRELFR